MRVGVIHGGTSTEHEVSLASGAGVLDALGRRGHEAVAIRIDRAGEWHTTRGEGRVNALTTLLTCDVVVPALHGTGGEDGTVQGLLEMLDLPYVGSGVRASAVCLDKALTKVVAERAGIPIAPGLLLDRARVKAAIARAAERSALLRELSGVGVELPLFVKPVHGGSSIGVTRVTDSAGLRDALVAAGDDAVLVEAEIVGLEVDVPVLELPDGELRVGPTLLIDSDPDEPFFTEAAKYASGATHFTVPAPLGAALTRRLGVLAINAFRALGCSGLARVDFFVTEGGPVLNEVNTFPGFTAQSQYPQMWAAAGLSYDDLVETLLQTALSRAGRRAPARP